MPLTSNYVRQHLIDPEICIRCNACLESCSRMAIDFDGANYIVDIEMCDSSQTCLRDCPTGAINNWLLVSKDQPYTLADQSSWSSLPEPSPPSSVQDSQIPMPQALPPGNGVHAPWSAAKPESMLFTPDEPIVARVKSNIRLTASDTENDIHHIVLDFGAVALHVLEGQTIGILPEAVDANGHIPHMRAYSVASPRGGETAGCHDVTLTVKRISGEWNGRPYRGIGSNFLCDRLAGDTVRCVGPIGTSFLLPEHPGTRLLMICTGTGIAPMRGFIQHRQRMAEAEGDQMMLFYGGRSPSEMAYHDELSVLPNSLVEVRTAYSRTPDEPRRYVQDLLLEACDEISALLDDRDCYIYMCGLRMMEDGVMDAFSSICKNQGKDWASYRRTLQDEGRLHIETY